MKQGLDTPGEGWYSSPNTIRQQQDRRPDMGRPKLYKKQDQQWVKDNAALVVQYIQGSAGFFALPAFQQYAKEIGYGSTFLDVDFLASQIIDQLVENRRGN